MSLVMSMAVNENLAKFCSLTWPGCSKLLRQTARLHVCQAASNSHGCLWKHDEQGQQAVPVKFPEPRRLPPAVLVTGKGVSSMPVLLLTTPYAILHHEFTKSTNIPAKRMLEY